MAASGAMTRAPTLDDIERLARAAFSEIPAELRRLARDVPITVEEFPDEAAEKEMELDSPFDILGLYRGTSLRERSVGDSHRLPAMVHLYRRPILDYWCETGETLEDIVRNVLIHEIGHHFGLSDDDMDTLERDG
jgi:predicted Zn-dependent protease with MMP-like domain